ncbi:hypothetical protein [Burkholderia sp. LMG 13014]|uniref:hypothetical protein n=1 Tax=Burkholderia sp. LMG 13014 TaxID=2709306 RepID=UPI0019635F05|nr:hypothetical protein [Burkholderia sp. LMG 13014]
MNELNEHDPWFNTADDVEPVAVPVESPARARGVSVPGVAVAVLTSGAVAAAGVVVLLFTLRGLLPPPFALAAFPLLLGAVAMLTAGLDRADDEHFDRWLGLSYRGEQRVEARQAYADLWRRS